MRGYDRAEYLPPGMRRRMDFQMLTDLIGRLTGVAERGEAAAEFAHRLAASPEGQSLIASLRQVVVAPGARRVSATRDCARGSPRTRTASPCPPPGWSRRLS